MNSSNVLIDGCTFIKCANKTINVNSLSETGDFVFTNNFVENVHQLIIHAINMKVKPTINNNVFQIAN